MQALNTDSINHLKKETDEWVKIILRKVSELEDLPDTLNDAIIDIDSNYNEIARIRDDIVALREDIATLRVLLLVLMKQGIAR